MLLDISSSRHFSTSFFKPQLFLYIKIDQTRDRSRMLTRSAIRREWSSTLRSDFSSLDSDDQLTDRSPHYLCQHYQQNQSVCIQRIDSMMKDNTCQPDKLAMGLNIKTTLYQFKIFQVKRED